MHYKTELTFFCSLLQNFHIPYQIFSPSHTPKRDPDLGIRRLINPDIDFSQITEHLSIQYKPNKIYRIYDNFLCNYLFFMLPDTKTPAYMAIGPYLLNTISSEKLMEHLEPLSLPLDIFFQIDKLYHALPLLADESNLLTMLFTFGAVIWGSMEQFSLETLDHSLFESIEPSSLTYTPKEIDSPLLSTRLLENQYATENRFLEAVTQGLPHKAELHLGNYYMDSAEKRVSDPIRHVKNYTIILNTLLRKAVESANVPLIHIHNLSSRYGRELEQITSIQSGYRLQKEMIRKYSMLVQNHNMKGYSTLIRKVLLRIDSDLAGDLSLKTHASVLNINASYLSTLFKKEVGMTLTEYVNRKRMDHALFLINSTDMQIQTIAQMCGIPDVNYFTKLFKKQIGKTPTEYRNSLRSI